MSKTFVQAVRESEFKGLNTLTVVARSFDDAEHGMKLRRLQSLKSDISTASMIKTDVNNMQFKPE